MIIHIYKFLLKKSEKTPQKHIFLNLSWPWNFWFMAIYGHKFPEFQNPLVIGLFTTKKKHWGTPFEIIGH